MTSPKRKRQMHCSGNSSNTSKELKKALKRFFLVSKDLKELTNSLSDHLPTNSMNSDLPQAISQRR